MSAHTKGPWIYSVEHGDTRVIKDADGVPLQCDEQYYPWVSRNPADWHLIAAAPELLAALQDCIADLELSGYAYDHPFLVRQRAIVDKATGGQP